MGFAWAAVALKDCLSTSPMLKAADLDVFLHDRERLNVRFLLCSSFTLIL